MKIRKIILEEKYFYSFIIGTLFVCSLILILKHNWTSKATFFTPIEDSKTIQEDLNGDSKKDILYVKKDDKNYYVQINLHDGTSYGLDPSKEIPTLGESATHWPMRVSILDASRNNIKEIFLQCSFHGKPVQHIFNWNDKGYKDIFCSNNNIIGFSDIKNNKTPKIISANISNGKINYESFIFIKDSLKKFDYNYPANYMGSDVIISFLTLVQSFPNDALALPSYFYNNISGNDLNLLYGTANNNMSYLFQDGSFKDLSWDSNGISHEIKWTLNFKATSLADNKIQKNLTFDLVLTKYNNTDGSYSYKITSLNLR
jgi:hypothetical protein